MGYPVAPGEKSYSGTFIPELWSSKLLEKFYTATVFQEISNTDYIGEISGGGADKVIVRTTPNMTIFDYVKGQKLTYTQEESANIEILVDKGKGFGFPVNDIDRAQADIKWMNAWSDDAGLQLKIRIDGDVINAVDADAHASNVGLTAGVDSACYNMGAVGAPITLTKANILDYIVDAGSVLSEQDIPEDEGRWFVLPTWACGMIKKSDLKDASLTGDGESTLRNGRIGRIDNFTIYKTNNYTLGAAGLGSFLFGHKKALAFASQLVKVETLRNPDDFGDLVRGLHVYGYKVVQPTGLGVLYAQRG